MWVQESRLKSVGKNDLLSYPGPSLARGLWLDTASSVPTDLTFLFCLFRGS